MCELVRFINAAKQKKDFVGVGVGVTNSSIFNFFYKRGLSFALHYINLHLFAITRMIKYPKIVLQINIIKIIALNTLIDTKCRAQKG